MSSHLPYTQNKCTQCHENCFPILLQLCQSVKNADLTYPFGTTVESYEEEVDGSITMTFKEDIGSDSYAR